MPILKKSRVTTTRPSACNETRLADWLRPAYLAPEWRITDSHGGSDESTLSFRFRMPDGRCLTEWPKFYAAVKEYAYFFRDDRYTRVADAEVQTSSVRTLMVICHGLALDGFTSFEHVSAKVIKHFLVRMKAGNDGVLKASDRLSNWLGNRQRIDSDSMHAGLPLRAGSTARRPVLDSARLMEMVGLPETACQLARVAYLCNQAACEAGMKHDSAKAQADELPPERKLTVQALFRFLSALELLYVMRGSIDAASLPERPFTPNASDVAKKHGAATRTTPIPPAGLTLHLLSHAMLWVANYSEPLLALWSDTCDLRNAAQPTLGLVEEEYATLLSRTPTEGPDGSPWPLAENPSSKREDLLPAHAAIRLLFAACFIVIAAFSARRNTEILTLEPEDIQGSDTDGWSLRPFIEKTLMRKDWIPIPDIAARAFHILLTLSVTAREMTSTKSLFQWFNPFLQKPSVTTCVLQHTNDIDEFSEWVRTPPWSPTGDNPTAWHWTPHQFRKFFAVLYFYRYRGATIEVLAHFLRHFNLEMTRKYLTLDRDVKRIFDEIEWGFTKQVARTIVLKGEAAQGGMAKRLAKQWLDHLRTTVRVTSATLEDATSYVSRQMRQNKLVLTPKAWVDCSCPRTNEAAKNANCRKGTIVDSSTLGPDFARAGPPICVDCAFSIDNGRLQECLAEEALHAERMSVSELHEGSLLSGILAERVVRIHRYTACERAREETNA